MFANIVAEEIGRTCMHAAYKNISHQPIGYDTETMQVEYSRWILYSILSFKAADVVTSLFCKC